MKKCYNCRKEHQRKGKIFCKECEKKPREKPSPTLIIYDKI